MLSLEWCLEHLAVMGVGASTLQDMEYVKACRQAAVKSALRSGARMEEKDMHTQKCPRTCIIVVPQTVFCCRGSGGVSSVLDM